MSESKRVQPIPTPEDLELQLEGDAELDIAVTNLYALAKVAYQDLADQRGLERVERQYRLAKSLLKSSRQTHQWWLKISEQYDYGNDHKYTVAQSIADRINDMEKIQQRVLKQFTPEKPKAQGEGNG